MVGHWLLAVAPRVLSGQVRVRFVLIQNQKKNEREYTCKCGATVSALQGVRIIIFITIVCRAALLPTKPPNGADGCSLEVKAAGSES